MKYILSLLAFYVSAISYAQLNQLKGTWISKTMEVLHIEDTLIGKSNHYLSNSQQEKKVELFLKSDTLCFKHRYFSKNNTKKQVVETYTFKLVKLDNQSLTLLAVSKSAKSFFKAQVPVIFRKQLLVPDTTIQLEKIVFHTTGCFGNCPTLHIQIDAKRTINYFSEIVYKKGSRLRDSSAIGYYKGIISPLNFKMLQTLIQSSGIDTLTYKEVTCCDAPVRTLVVYYNGKRKYFKSMLTPASLHALIDFLNSLPKQTPLKKTKEKFLFEN